MAWWVAQFYSTSASSKKAYQSGVAYNFSWENSNISSLTRMPWLIVSAPKRTMNWLPSLVSSHCLAILFFKTIASPWRAAPLWGTDTFHGCRPRSGEDPCFLGSGLWIDHFWWTTWHSTCLPYELCDVVISYYTNVHLSKRVKSQKPNTSFNKKKVPS